MINYDRDAWWRTVFSFGGTVLPHVLGRVGLLTALCLGLVLFNDYVLVGLHAPIPELDPFGHMVLGTALSLLIVFRTNSSFARYWEARTLWGGVVNTSRNLARTAASQAKPADDFGRLIIAYTIALKQGLRGSKDLSAIQVLVPATVYENAAKASDPPGVIARAMTDWIACRRKDSRFSQQQAQHMDELVDILVNQQGGCERIRKTPLPFVYAALIKQVLLVYLVTLPFVLVARMGFAAPLVVAVVALGLLGIEEAGVEVENPFGTAPNSLPLEGICETISSNVAEASAE